MIRKPAVAGMFYEEAKEGLISEIEQCFMGSLGPGMLPETKGKHRGDLLGLVCPHAGYIYSGSAAAYSYRAMADDGLPDVVVILGPNHYGLGPAVSISAVDKWETPLGILNVDIELAHEIEQLSQYAQCDNLAHSREHSIEVQLPFLQYIAGDNIKIVPISIAYLNEANAGMVVSDLGAAIAKALEGRRAVVIASTDFTHQESKASAQIKDSAAIDEILKLDDEGLLRVVYGRSISMCGAVGTAIMIKTCKTLGATRAQKLTYYTSGDVIGNTDEVVGYSAISLSRNIYRLYCLRALACSKLLRAPSS